MAVDLQRAEFVLSAVSPKNFIQDGLPQVAFAGRSNVGKSSVINRLLNRKNLARVGSAPGKTIHVNYFDICPVTAMLRCRRRNGTGGGG